MSKEWLEFFGGLFVFLAALVPVFRAAWRALRKRLTPRGLAVLSVLAATVTINLFVLVGLLLNWAAMIEIGLLSLFIVGQTTVFLIDDAPINRTVVAFFLLPVALTTVILGGQLARLPQKPDQKSVATPTPSASITPHFSE